MENKLPVLDKRFVNNKRVFLRLDLDVPTENGKIKDETRLIAGLKTLRFLLNYSSKIIICGHLGRPIGFDKNLSLKPVAEWFKDKLKIQNLKFKNERIGDFLGWEIGEKIFLLENIRFYEEEEKNDKKFSQKLARLADVYVNDAFAASHRNHASIAGVPKYIMHLAGFNLENEIKNLSVIFNSPQKPSTVIIGGAKIETKLPLVEKMDKIVDSILIGGKIALEKNKIKSLKILKDGKIFIASSNKEGKDINKEDISFFKKIINKSRMIIWNGPVGKIEEKDYRKGTEEIARAIIKAKAFSIIGGGDTIDFVKKIGLVNKFSFVSTGGGAMLSFLSGEKLPGLEVLKT